MGSFSLPIQLVLIVINLKLLLAALPQDNKETIHIKRALFSPNFFDNLKLPETLSNNILDSSKSNHHKNEDELTYDHLCVNQFNAILHATTRSEMWAMSMLDSWGKFPSGILYGNNNELGNFDECLSVTNKIMPNTTFVTSRITGKYCLAQMYSNQFGLPRKNSISHSLSVKGMDARMLAQQSPNHTFFSVFVGVCVPSTCSPLMVDAILDRITEYFGLPVQASVTEQMCSDSLPLPWSVIDVATIVIFSTIVVVMVASTVYDVKALRNGCPRNGFLVAFSVYTNTKYIFNRHSQLASSNKRLSIDCLHGVRMLSLAWVILGHSYLNMAYGPTVNTYQLYEWLQSDISMMFVTTTVCVDSFFMISGLLVTMSLLKYFNQTSGKMNPITFYVHRYIRLTPALAALVLVYSSISRRFGDGPLWNLYQGTSNDRCRDYWWSVLLYAQNYVNPNSMCLGHLWYLSVDMQLYLFSPVLIYPLWRWRYKFLAVMPLLTILTMVAIFVLFVVNEFSARLSTSLLAGPRMTLVYVNTPCRMGPWLVGIVLGFVLHELSGKQPVIRKLWTTIGWTCCSITLALVFLLNYPIQSPTHTESILEGAFYEAISRVAWSAALAWLVFACVHGYGGPVNWFLSLPEWQPLARMAYSIYLLHLPIQIMMGSRMRSPAYFSDSAAFNTFWATLGYSVIASLFWTLAFDSPMLAIERAWTPLKSAKRNSKNELTNAPKST